MKKRSLLEKKAALVRKWCLISTTTAGSGHPTTCLSSADLMTYLFDKHFRYDLKNPLNPNNDRLIFSKGHAAPLLYTLYAMSGAFPVEELKTLRQFSSPLEGHPTPNFPYTEAATGSLGQGLSVGAGIAISAQRDNLPIKTYVLLGDGECAEGNVWEAANFASYYKLENLIAIVDVNRLGQSQETMFGHHVEAYAKRFAAFGWQVVRIDGHDFKQIEKAFKLAVNNKSGKPFAIIAKTKKGNGISFLANKENWHGKPLKKEDLEKALSELGEINESLRFELSLPPKSLSRRKTQNLTQKNADSNPSVVGSNISVVPRTVPLSSALGTEVATREVYGKMLAVMGSVNPLVYSLDGDTKNSTYAEFFKDAHPERFVECFIAEQNMVGVAVGLARMGKIPFVSTFSAFLTRTFDQVRMAGISKSNIKFCGSHAGISIGEDGGSQMALEDIAMFGVIPDSLVFHPSDAISTAKLIPHMVTHNGTSFLRTLRPKTPVIYDAKEEFDIGGSKIVRKSKDDLLTVVGCGITVHEAIKAQEELKKKGVNIRVVDCYSIKPIDEKTLKKCVKETKKNIVITVEEHYEHGGLGDFVLSALSDTEAKVYKMCVRKLPRSGTKDELMEFEEINAKYIVKKVESLI